MPTTHPKPAAPAAPTPTAQIIADHVGGDLFGPGDTPITGINDLAHARCGDLTFVGDQRYADRWPTSQASAVLAKRDLSLRCDNARAMIRVDDADLALSRALELFEHAPVQTSPGIDPSAKVHPEASLGQNLSIGPGCYLGPGVSIGAGCVLHANVVVLDHAQIGKQVQLWPGVVIGARCLLGDQTVIHPNAVIGSDGFGYRPDKDDRGKPLIRKLNHIGTVRIGSRVEIGAGTCIDRAKFAQTTVGDQTKIDNLVQIGHNCRIGEGVLIAGSCAIAGTVSIGDGAMLGGGAHVADHLEIGAGAQIAGSAGVIGDVPAGATWAGAPAKPIKTAAREELAIRRLPDLVKRMKSQ